MMIFLGIIGIYLLMSFLMTFIYKYLDAKEKKEAEEKGKTYEDDSEYSPEWLGFLWPVTFPLLIIVCCWQCIELIEKGMDKLIEKIINKK